MNDLTHFDAQGQAHMVDVGGKAETRRTAVAEGWIRMQPATLARIREGSAAKGDVLGVARLAAIMAAKRRPTSFRCAIPSRCRAWRPSSPWTRPAAACAAR